MPRVSVIIPCFNHASFLGEAIEGVLGQTFTDLELIVIDDCSLDNSKEVIERYGRRDARVRVIYHETNRGLAHSRDDGIKIAVGQYVAFCDADDVWMPTKLSRQIELLDTHLESDVAYSDASIINECGVETGERFSDRFPIPGNGSGKLLQEFCTRNFVNIQTAVVRRACIAKAGYFADGEGITVMEDWWFWLRVAPHHSFIYTGEVLAKYRVHENSISVGQRQRYAMYRVKIYHRILQKYCEIPPQLKSEVYYHLGVALTGRRKVKSSRRCFIRSLRFRPLNLRALCRLLLSLYGPSLCTRGVLRISAGELRDGDGILSTR